MQVWIGGIYEEKGGKTLCHVFAGGKRLATFEPASGGPYASIWSPKTWWARGGEWATAATAWPFQHNRTPATVLVTTLLAIFFLSITARRGWRWNPNATILQGLRQLATLAHRMGEGLGVRARGVEKTGMRADQSSRSRRGNEPVIFSEENCEPPHVGCYELTKRERRWFTQPIWRQAISVLLMVALIFTTTPTHVQAQTYTPVFYYYVGDHLGSSNVMTDRAGVLVEHYEYTAFGFAKCSTGTAFQVSNRYTGQVLDDETGLYYYNSRYYDSALGRFIQPDTIVPSPGDPQTLNRYSYVNNNPLKYVDPTGHDFGVTALIIAVVVGAAIGGATAAASGGNIGIGILTGALGGALGFVGAWAGGVLGAAAGGAAGGAVNAAITGGDIGMGALTGAISGAIAFGVSQAGYSSPQNYQEHLWNGALASAGGAAGGATGAAITGGDAGLGAAYGAAGGAIGYAAVAGLSELTDGPASSGGGKNSAYETVSAVIEPASVDKFGHSGIAFPGTDEYYDYGPQNGKGAKPWGSRGQAWWRSKAESPTWTSVQKHIAKLQASGGSGPVWVVSLDVSPAQAQAIRSYWNSMEASGGTYRWFSRQCSTTAAASLRAGGISVGQPLTPSGFLARALQLRSTSGPYSGVPMSRATILKP